MQYVTLGLNVFLLWICIKEHKGFRYVPDECRTGYSSGSLSEPCGYCHVCIKEIDSNNRQINHCTSITKWLKWKSIAFLIGSYGKGKTVCANLPHCNLYCKCKHSLYNGCVNLLAACKCACDEGYYGQECEKVIPIGLSTELFADIDNVIYAPYIYSTDFAEFELYFYNTGTNLKVQVQTEREFLTFNEDKCKRNLITSEDHCKKIFEGTDVKNIDELCKSKPSYKQHFSNQVCSLSINLAFPRSPLEEWNKEQFVLDYPTIQNVKPIENIVGKAEYLTISVFNEISNIPQQIFTSDYGLMVIYIGKSNIERCGPLVTINQFSSKMYDMNTFSRRQEFTVVGSVTLNESPLCQTFGEPTVTWIVWIIAYNHNEKSDPPFIHKEQTSGLEFPPYTLWYGVYKVKHQVILNTNYFSYGASYCYFKIVPLPLDPVVFGGSLRYVYYKNNLELMTSPLVNPNFPSNEQPKLECMWYCNDTSDAICQRRQSVSFHNIWHMLVLTLSSPLTPGKAYNFTMEIISPNSSLVESSNQVIVVSKDPIPDLLIECLMNCGGKNMKSNTEEILYFRVLHSQYSIPNRKGSVLNWTYSTTNTPDTNVKTIRQIEETPSWILIINERSLNFDQLYTFKVFGGGEMPGEAQITVTTSMSNISDSFQCTINPTDGIAGKSKFQINCTDGNNKQKSQTFTFYDQINEDDENSRMLCSSFTGIAENVILTRGQVVVFATNMYGQSKYTTSSVTLHPQEITSELLTKSLKTIETLAKNEGYEQKLSFISAIGDVLDKNTSLKLEAMDIFLEIISKEKVSNLVKLEMLLSTTLSVICQKDDCTKPAMIQKSYEYLVTIFSQVTAKFISVINFSNEDSDLTTTKVLKLYKLILQCAGVLLNVQDKHLESKDYNIYKLYKYGNLKAISSLYKVNTGLAIRNLPYTKSTVVESSTIESYMKEDNANYFTKTKYKDNSFINMPSELADYLNKNFSTVVIQTIDFKNNPYWWSISDQVTTDVLSLKVGSVKRERDLQNVGNYKSIRILKYPIDIYLRKHTFKNETFGGSVTQPHPGADPDVNDLAVAVHQIYPSKGSKVSVRFVDLSESDVLNVLIELNQRPDYDMVQEKGITITALTPWYYFSKEINNEEDFVFVGILPGSNVSVGDIIKYKFEVQSARCQVWYDVAWSTSGCKVGKESTEHHLHCQCNHLSVIAGVLKVPMNTVNPFEDYKLFLTIPDNPYVFAFITTIFIIYIILLIWTCKIDRKDHQKTNLIILEDNISSDLYGYLIIVCTGSRLFAKTSSNIGIILNGSECNSRSHILRSSNRATLQRGSDDWFLLYAPEYLGVISSIQLWTDHSGPTPNWFCSRIYVHDLDSKDDYAFVVDQWFGITQTELCIEKRVSPITFENDINFSAYFLTNAISGFRENHLLVSIAGAYPRSPLLKSQRLSMAMVALMATLLTSIMFYDVAMPQVEDVPSYRITIQEVVISVYSLIIATIVTSTVAFAFKKSYVTKQKGNIQLKKQQKIQVDRLKVEKITKESERNLLIYYLHKVILSLRVQHFFPIKAATDTHAYIVVHKIRAVIAWVFCMLVILINAYLVILYGLKIGKVKSLLWLTSIGLSFGEDNFLVNPVKIIMLAVLFGIFEAQFCDMYAYDPNIYKIKKESQINIDKDTNIHELRLKPYYKHVSRKRLETIKTQQMKVQKWWTFIDIIDICFPAVLIFAFVSWYSYAYYNNALFERLLFKYVHSEDKLVYTSLHTSTGVLEYLQYLEHTILPAIYSTVWYNKLPLTADLEAFKETGWTADATHRVLGVPRLRQIRVRKQYCKTPQLLQNLSTECNVLFSSSTEDRGSYGAIWKGSSWNDILFRNSPWTYHTPENSTSITTYSKLGESFHGGGYLVELSRTQSKSEAIIFQLIDTKWLDWRTHVVFLEMTTYNVNVNAFSSIVFLAQFLENKLILVGTQIMSLFSRNKYIYIEFLGFLYGILGICKLIMTFNNVGMSFFFKFWTMYDLILISIGLSCLVGYRLFLVTSSMYIRDFQSSGKDTFFQFQKLFLSFDNEMKLLAIYFTLINIRLLRLINFGIRNIGRKQIKILHVTYSEIGWMTLILVLVMFISQQLMLYLRGGFFHVQNIDNFDLVRNYFLLYLPYLLHPAVLMYIVIILQGYRRASGLLKK